MTRWMRSGIMAMACVLGATVAVTSASPPGLAGRQELPKGQGQAVAEQMCGSACHGIDKFASEHRSKSQWMDTLEQMKGSGAKGSDEDFKTVLSYLIAHMGVQVKINTATAKVIDDVLELEPGQADAIVKYRETNGPFADWPAFLKVPGLDVKKLEEQKTNVIF